MSSASRQLIIGPSTGWVFAKDDFSLSGHQRILSNGKVQSNAFEVPLGGWDRESRRIKFLLKNGSFLRKVCGYRSLHLSGISHYRPEEVSLAGELVGSFGASAALTHPEKVDGEYPWEVYQMFLNKGVPLAIENMDKNKTSGFVLNELVDLVAKANCGFVLDLQHAFEHDPSMVYAQELLDAFSDRIVHYHVSGQTEDNNHALVCRADNNREIVDFLNKALARKNAPVILEGEYSGPDELQKELKFLRKALKAC